MTSQTNNAGFDVRELRLDWFSYWNAFRDAHGGDYVEFEGVLLFRDGARYGKSYDYRGPEQQPPDDPVELKRLKSEYWRKVRAEYDQRRRHLADYIDQVRLDALNRRLPLFVARYMYNSDGRTAKTGGEMVVDWDGGRVVVHMSTPGEDGGMAEMAELDLTAELEALMADVAACDQQLAALEEPRVTGKKRVRK